MPRTIKELTYLVGREPIDIQMRNKWIVCVFEPDSGHAIIRVHLRK